MAIRSRSAWRSPSSLVAGVCCAIKPDGTATVSTAPTVTQTIRHVQSKRQIFSISPIPQFVWIAAPPKRADRGHFRNRRMVSELGRDETEEFLKYSSQLVPTWSIHRISNSEVTIRSQRR